MFIHYTVNHDYTILLMMIIVIIILLMMIIHVESMKGITLQLK
jgi:hypothetical protein